MVGYNGNGYNEFKDIAIKFFTFWSQFGYINTKTFTIITRSRLQRTSTDGPIEFVTIEFDFTVKDA